MSKKRKQRRPNLSPLVLLRSRLKGLLGNEAQAEKDAPAFKADLDALCKGLEAYKFLPLLLKVYPDIPAQVQARLDEIVPEWLGERKYVDALFTLLNQRSLDGKSSRRARAWLKAANVDLPASPASQHESAFYQAYSYYDDSQGLILVLWYTHKQRKAQGMSFLVDFNPPWEGAIKDIIVFPTRPPKSAAKRYVDAWRQQGMALKPLSAAEVKQEVLESLEANRNEEIRLPRDLIRARDMFLKHVLSLPDTPETPSFTEQDFDALSRTGETPESIMRFEQTVGRRIRLEDGSELLVMGDPFFDEEGWFEDDEWE